MKRESLLLAAVGLAAVLAGGTALAGNYGHGVPHPGKGYGHVKHHGHGHSRHSYRGRGHHGYRYSRHFYTPPRVVHYLRTVTHVHGPGCGHHGYARYRSYGHHRYGHSPYYRRDYGRAAFSGYDDGLGYYLEFRY